MTEDRVYNLLWKKLVEIKVDRSPFGEDKIVVFRGKLENLLLVIAVNCQIGSNCVTSKRANQMIFHYEDKGQKWSVLTVKLKLAGYFVGLLLRFVCTSCHFN